MSAECSQDENGEAEYPGIEEENEDEREEEGDEIDIDVEMIQLADLQAIAPFRRLMCAAHSVHAASNKKAYSNYDSVLIKARHCC